MIIAGLRGFAIGAAVVLAGLTAARGEELTTWRHGVLDFKSDAGFLMMPTQHDFAARHGLKIELVQLNGDPMQLKALLSGSVDSYESSPGSAIVAASRGADIKLVGCQWPLLTNVLLVKGSIKTVDDLRGKTLATSGPGSQPDLLARIELEKFHVPASEVHFAMLGSDGDRMRALESGVVDGAVNSTEYIPELAARGINMLADFSTEAPNYLRFCTFMSSKTIAARRSEAVRFVATLMEGVGYAYSHPDEAVALTRELIHAKPDNQRPEYLASVVEKVHAIDPTMPVAVDKLTWMQDLLVRAGSITKPFDINSMVDPTLRVEALALVKPQ